MAEKETTKSRRDAVLERLRSRHPDTQLEEDEDIFGRISDDYDDYEERISKADEHEKAFSDMFTSDPRSARLMMEWKNGEDPAVALLRIYGDDIKEALDDPEKQEAIAAANKEYMERVSKESDYEREYTENLQQTLKLLEEYQSECGYSDEQIDNAMERVVGISKDAMMGKFSKETLDMIFKALNYDSAVEEAGAEGELRGRNSKIEEKLRTSVKGDGTAALDGKNNANKNKEQRDLGALDRYGDSMQDIYSRGGWKRNSHNK